MNGRRKRLASHGDSKSQVIEKMAAQLGIPMFTLELQYVKPGEQLDLFRKNVMVEISFPLIDAPPAPKELQRSLFELALERMKR